MVEVNVIEWKRPDSVVGLSRVCRGPTLFWISAEGLEWCYVKGVQSELRERQDV